jgi:hypothetical protein
MVNETTDRYLEEGVEQYQTDLEFHYDLRMDDGYSDHPTLVPLSQKDLDTPKSGWENVTRAGRKAVVSALKEEYGIGEDVEHPYREIHEKLAIEPNWDGYADPDDWHTRYIKLPVGRAVVEPDHVAVYSVEHTDQEIEPMHDPSVMSQAMNDALKHSESGDSSLN